LVGSIDTERTERFTASLLASVREKGAETVIIDLTGLAAVDTAIGQRLVLAASTARLLGANVLITGLSTENSIALARLGTGLEGIQTLGTLEDGIEEAGRSRMAAKRQAS
jgi:rsbT co-antagonist protein RsbR